MATLASSRAPTARAAPPAHTPQNLASQGRGNGVKAKEYEAGNKGFSWGKLRGNNFFPTPFFLWHSENTG